MANKALRAVDPRDIQSALGYMHGTSVDEPDQTISIFISQTNKRHGTFRDLLT
jgi:hypothetical protein